MDTLDHLRKASELIADNPVANRSQFSEAAGHFWSATFDEENWPLSLRVASTSLKAKLLAEGTIITTIQALDPEHASATAEELAQFCLDARDQLTSDRQATNLEAHRLKSDSAISRMSLAPKS